MCRALGVVVEAVRRLVEPGALTALELVHERRLEDGVDGEVADLDLEARVRVATGLANLGVDELIGKLARVGVGFAPAEVGPRRRRPPQDTVSFVEPAREVDVGEEDGDVAVEVAHRHVEAVGELDALADPHGGAQPVLDHAAARRHLPPSALGNVFSALDDWIVTNGKLAHPGTRSSK